jgi:hypothetical protein
MATPSGDPNVSLLPQPANPVPIEPMRGGGTENISLLPQPSIPVPIEPMKGGALQGTLQKFIFSPKAAKLQPYQEKTFKYKENVNKYIAEFDDESKVEQHCSRFCKCKRSNWKLEHQFSIQQRRSCFIVYRSCRNHGCESNTYWKCQRFVCHS